MDETTRAAGDGKAPLCRRPPVALIALLGPTLLAVAPTSAQPAPRATERDWPMFRGGPTLTGVAQTRLPDKPAVRWRITFKDAIESSAAIVDGVVYVGSDDGQLYALDLATGAAKWKYNAGQPIKSSPTVYDGRVYFGDDLGVFHALDAGSGAKEWTYKTDDQIISSANVVDGRVVVGSYDGFLYCLDARSGKLAWKYAAEDRLHATPGLAGQNVLVAGCDAYLHIVDPRTGKAKRKVALGSVCGASAAALRDRVFLGTYGNQVVGIDWQQAKVLWSYEHETRQFPYMASAALTPDRVLIGGRDKRFRSLDAATGTQQWEFVVKGRVDSSGVIVGSRVFFGCSDGTLYALAIPTGAEVWRFEAGGPMVASPAVAAESLVIGTLDGDLYCFGAAGPQPK